jgi:hypothetical protein
VVRTGGDFNGDGKSDIFWGNSDNRTSAIWLMDGNNFIGGGGLPDPGPGWLVVGTGTAHAGAARTGDFNGDGKSDLLWQNVDGTPAIWFMNGSTFIGGGAADPPDNALPVTSATLGSPTNMQFVGDPTAPALTATSGSDEFDLTSNAAAAYSISGFNPSQDLVDLSTSKIADFADLQAHSTALGNSTLIALGSDSSLLIQGIPAADLDSPNFRFV